LLLEVKKAFLDENEILVSGIQTSTKLSGLSVNQLTGEKPLRMADSWKAGACPHMQK
jgi:hypothetical protein